MRGTERVIHVKVGKAGQLLREFLVVGFFLGVKAKIFEQQSLSLLQLARHFAGLRPDALRAEPHVLTPGQFLVQQHAQALRHRLKAHLRIRLPLGPAEVRRQNHARPMPQRILDRRQGLANAGFVHDAPVFERHVEIHPHEDTMIVQRQITDRKLGHGGIPVRVAPVPSAADDARGPGAALRSVSIFLCWQCS